MHFNKMYDFLLYDIMVQVSLIHYELHSTCHKQRNKNLQCVTVRENILGCITSTLTLVP